MGSSAFVMETAMCRWRKMLGCDFVGTAMCRFDTFPSFAPLLVDRCCEKWPPALHFAIFYRVPRARDYTKHPFCQKLLISGIFLKVGGFLSHSLYVCVFVCVFVCLFVCCVCVFVCLFVCLKPSFGRSPKKIFFCASPPLFEQKEKKRAFSF